MRTLKYAILGLINRGPITGYDITKEFHDRALANFWNAKHSQVYPELNKLVEEKLVEFQVIIQGEKMEKKLYSITEKGATELIEWLKKDEPLEITPKDKFRLRTYFSDFMPEGVLDKHLKSQLKKHQLKLSYLKDLFEGDYKEIPAPYTKEFGDYIVLEGAIMRENSYIEWLKKSLSYLK